MNPPAVPMDVEPGTPASSDLPAWAGVLAFVAVALCWRAPFRRVGPPDLVDGQ